ncbi:universal stress protein [Rhizobium sp. FY34]|uniref:universal stress protein n=1 Tax=Rhizobium sp. FY34 TaxID=2562309 RepID=UPI0010BF6D36|nr:universal stress protein [Rhizobium sp. FY34]
MGYKTIVTVADTMRHAQPVTDFALSIAQQFSAHLIGLRAEGLATVPLIAPMEIPDPTAIEMLQKAAQDETHRIETLFRARATQEGVSHEWRTYVCSAGYGSQSVLECARTSDLIIACQTDPRHGHDGNAELETLLMESGRPLLLVPYVLTTPAPLRRVLIAWNGSKEAARAAFDALPLLKQADSVEIFCVDPPGMPRQAPELAGADLAAALARHDVKVTLRTEENLEISTADAIENRLTDASVDLLVMGGYGHARWWEMLFGGVTRSILDTMTAVTLISR